MDFGLWAKRARQDMKANFVQEHYYDLPKNLKSRSQSYDRKLQLQRCKFLQRHG
jgi:hypothetical protein